MKTKFLSLTSLALLQIVIVANLQPLSANAVYGFSLPFLYLLAAIGFFVPCIMMVSKLTTAYPQTGGAYIWVEKAFGKKMGFFTFTLLWISNLLWYPSLFSLIASNAAYIIDPQLATHKLFIMSFAVGFFWIITGLNCLGIAMSTRLSILSAVLGIILPIVLIITAGIYWLLSGHPLAVSLQTTPIIPDFSHINNLGFLIAVAICFFGIEIPAVHAGNVMQPEKNFPKSLWISGSLILLLTLTATLAISIIIPATQLSVVTGVLDAIQLFFVQLHLSKLLSLIFLIVFIGNIGSAMAWMLGSTRGMFVASVNNHVLTFLQKTNKNQAPIGVLIFEAVLFTLAMLVFLLFPKVSDSFWLLLDAASQITLVYYIILFASAITLKNNSDVFWVVMALGAITSILALLFGFIPPPDLNPSQILVFHSVLLLGLAIAMVLPLLLLKAKESKS